MMAGKASVQTYIASTSAEHLSVCEGCSGMCETCVSVLMSACAKHALLTCSFVLLKFARSASAACVCWNHALH